MSVFSLPARGLVFILLLLSALPLAGAEESTTAKTCVTPKFVVEGWEDPNTLVLTSTSDPDRDFNIQIGVNKLGSENLEGDADHLCREEDTSELTKNGYKFAYLACYSRTLGKDPSPIHVHFSRANFQRLLDEDGKIHVHIKSVDDKDCKIDHWQDDLRVYNRSLFRIEAGAGYGLNGSGNWDSRGEAAVRFNTRWRTDYSGTVDLRYSGVTKTQSQTPTAATNADDSSQNFNPFKAGDGVLRGDFYVGYHLSTLKMRQQKILPTLSDTLVLGFGLSTLKGLSSGRQDLTNSKRRLFLGYRLTVPRFKTDTGVEGPGEADVKSLKEITAPRGYFQLSYARDEIWKFTVPPADTTTGSPIQVDKRNRMVIDGIFEFFEIPTSGDSIPISVRLRWDTPFNLNGASDLRISILGAFNFFKL